MNKILFKNHIFKGGAPKSMLEYAKVARKNFDVITLGEIQNKTSFEELYQTNNIKLVSFKAFDLKQPLKNFKLLMKYMRVIKEEQPILIQSVAAPNMFFDYIVSKCMNIPVIYLVAGGVFPKAILGSLESLFFEESFITFSKESTLELESLVKKNNNEVHIISNRITFENVNDGPNIYIEPKNIKALLVSRLDKGKLNSVYYTMGLIEQLHSRDIPICLTIIGDGKYYEDVKIKAEFINKNINKEVIKVLGHQDNIELYVLESHIVFGKGRSVLDGVFRKKISFVVNEKQQSFMVNQNSFYDLIESNFTGRNFKDLQNMTLSEYIVLCEQILDSQIDLVNLERINTIARESYDIEKVSDRIIKLYDNKINSSSKQKKYKINVLKVLYYYAKIYLMLFIKK